MRHSRIVASFVMAVCLLATTAAAADSAMFNYQGRVTSRGVNYTGLGMMKVAILATSGSTTVSLWSNNGSSVAGSEPTSSFPITVNYGVFDVMIGDTAVYGMQSLPAILFNRDDELKVRVWFNDGTHGFQQLSPDRRLTNPRRLGITEIHTSTTLFVNGTTGNDLNSGLSPSSAKKTIQAAVDMVPARLFNHATIEIAAGVYREGVKITGITAEKGYPFTLLGDKVTTPTETVGPNVRLTGCDNDSSHVKVRSNGISVTACENVTIAGFLLDYYSNFGYSGYDSRVTVNRCKASYCLRGFNTSGLATYFNSTWSNYNGFGYGIGYEIGTGSAIIENSGVTDNTYDGIIMAGGMLSLRGTNYIKRDTCGIFTNNMSMVWVETGTTYVQGNVVGVQIQMNSFARRVSAFSYSGNSQNLTVTSDSAVNTNN